MTRETRLLPCPFCGGEPLLKQYRADGLEIKCQSCHSGRQQRWLDKGSDWLAAKMVEKWNTRAALPEDVRSVLPAQSRLLPNHTALPHPPRHEGFLQPGREVPGYTLEQMKEYGAVCAAEALRQNK
jgi:hypothetical protein